MSNFENNVRAIFEKHGLEDNKLELVVTDLFEDFKTYLMYDRDFYESIEKSLDRKKEITDRFR